MNWLLDRLKEQSTWRGIVLLVTAFGVKLDPERGEAIIALGLAVVGLINVLRKERATVPGGKFNPRAEIRKALPSNSRGGNFKG
jgi:hypothetical protein